VLRIAALLCGAIWEQHSLCFHKLCLQLKLELLFCVVLVTLECLVGLPAVGKEETKYTRDGPGKPGGQSWTIDWLKFNNTYFKVGVARMY